MVTPPVTRVVRRVVTRPGVGRSLLALAVPAGAALALLVAAAAFAPLVVVLGMTRLAGLLLAGVGAWVIVGRAGSIDLSIGAAVGAGAVVAGIVAGELGVPALAVAPLAVVAGGAVGALAGVVTGRLGRGAGALGTLAFGAGIVAVARGVEATGGRSGYHAVPLLVGGDRTDAAVAVVLLAVGVGVAAWAAGSRLAARAAVAVAAPPVAAANGRRPALDVAVLGAVGGGLLGVAGLVGAAASGSVSVDGHGPDLTALLVLVAVLGEAARRAIGPKPGGSTGPGGPGGAVLAGLAIVGPGIVWPLAPLVGTAPPLLVMGPLGLGALALLARQTRLRPDATTASAPGHAASAAAPAVSAAPTASATHAPATAEATPPLPRRRLGVRARGLAVPGGSVDLDVRPGEVVALVGPNGAGKSTVLARIGGQLPSGDGVSFGLDDDLAASPRHASARARLGVARAWQQPPTVDPADFLAAVDGDGDGDARRWAEDVLPSAAPGTPAARSRAALVALTVRRPGLVLLDEPSALLGEASAVAAWVRGLADGGAAVLVVEHRPEVIAMADRIVSLERP